ncbi:D-glycerate 3-kinase [Citrus sinensis]|nr:D-glycerate 3-kinase [Citrus sinensis]
MSMATLNILLPTPSTNSHYFNANYSQSSHNVYFNTNNNSNNNTKLHSLPCSHSLPLLSSLFVQTKSNPSHKFSHMPTHLSKSEALSAGTGCSWMQNNSMLQSGEGCPDLKQGLVCSAIPTERAQVSSVQDLFAFICSGPLIDKMGFSKEKIGDSIDKWIAYNSYLCRLFQLNELYLTFPQKIGFSAPQGCGKTTLAFALDYLFRVTGRKSATISIDDFYLTAEGQAKLREANRGNALLEFRGNAGSHDLQLSVETLTAISKLTKEGTKMKLPRYDKSAYNGRGDRADPSTWPEIEGPLTVVLYEGWMLGFKPLPVEVVKAVDPQLETVNKNLEAYFDAWDKFIKAWIVIKIKDPSCVYEWRLQAEIAMREAGNPGMSDEEVKDFVSRYLPAYHAYLPTLYSEGPNGSDPEHTLIIEIDDGRNPI